MSRPGDHEARWAGAVDQHLQRSRPSRPDPDLGSLIPFGPVMGLATVAGSIIALALFVVSERRSVFVPIFDFILGSTTTEEASTGAGMLNAVQQFSGAIGVAALGTVFFARVNHGGTPAFDHAGELVIGLATMLFLITFALV